MKKQALNDEDEDTKIEYKMSKYIKEMDDEIKERFMALKVMEDMIREADKEEQKEIRKLEVQFEDKYKEIYRLREELINGKQPLDEKLIAEFDARAEKMKDEDYEKVEVAPCDVKSI